MSYADLPSDPLLSGMLPPVYDPELDQALDEQPAGPRTIRERLEIELVDRDFKIRALLAQNSALVAAGDALAEALAEATTGWTTARTALEAWREAKGHPVDHQRVQAALEESTGQALDYFGLAKKDAG